MRTITSSGDIRYFILVSFLFVVAVVGCKFSQPPNFKTLGGIQLIYEVDDSQPIDPRQAVEAMRERLDPTGSRGIEVQIVDGRMVISVPASELDDLKLLKKLAQAKATLSFRIVANRKDKQVADAVAFQGASANRNVTVHDKVVATWVAVQQRADGTSVVKLDKDTHFIRQRGNLSEILLLVTRDDMTGHDFTEVAKGSDESKRPTIDLSIKKTAQSKVKNLSGANLQRQMAIVIGDEVISAPTIQSPLDECCQISGSFTDDEVDTMVSLIRSGPLPFKLVDADPKSVQVAPSN